MPGGDAPDKRAADQLCEVLLAIEDVDLNALLDDEVRTLLDAKEELSELTMRCRNDQHALERNQDGP